MVLVLRGCELPPNHVKFTSRFYQKIHKNKRKRGAANVVQYQKFYNDVGQETYRHTAVPAEMKDDKMRTLHDKSMQGYPGSVKMLHELRTQKYSSNLVKKGQRFVDNCSMFIDKKEFRDKNMRPLLGQIYNPCNGP